MIYRSPKYCLECRRVRWPGDCAHGMKETGLFPLDKAVSIAMDRVCRSCGRMHKACVCHDEMRARNAVQRKVKESGWAGSWSPTLENVSLAWATCQQTGRDWSGKWSMDCQQSWLASQCVAFRAPRFFLENAEWCKRYVGVFPLPVKNLNRWLTVPSRPVTVSEDEIDRKTDDDTYYHTSEVCWSGGKADFVTELLGLFEGLELGVINEDHIDMIVAKNRFGSVLGVVAPWRADPDSD